MQEPKKQHYVPKFYLKHFAKPKKDDGDLYVFDKAAGIWRPEPSTPKDEGWAENANTIFMNDEPNYMFDRFLTEIESNAAKVVNRIVTDRVLPSKKDEDREDRARFALFMASSLVRTPGHRNFYREAVPMLFGAAMSDLTAQRAKQLSWLKKIIQPVLLPTMEQLLSDESLIVMIPATTLYFAEIIRRREWQLILADERGQHFITSDHPVSGFVVQETRIPLSPEVAVVTSDRIETEVVQADDKLVRLVNCWTYMNAQSFIYGDQVDDLLLHDMDELRKNPQVKPEIAYLKEALPHITW